MRKHKASLGEHGEGTVERRLWGCCPDKAAYCLQTPWVQTEKLRYFQHVNHFQ